MKIAYIGSGDPSDNRVCTVFGLTFTLDEWIEMEDVPEALLGNPTFATEAVLTREAATGYGEMKVKELRALASDRGVDLGDAVLKADIIAAFELHDEQAAAQA